MRYPILFSLLTCFLACQVSFLYGQSKQVSASFPTYQQIRPAGPEVFDYMPQQMTKEIIEHKIIFNLFDYPEGEVTYFLNGIKTTNASEAKTIINQKENQINNIAIGEPTTDGKRIIRIDFTLKK
jgi:hypothetical protein